MGSQIHRVRAALLVKFEDLFNRADSTFGLGENYISQPRSSVQSSQALPYARIATTHCFIAPDGAGAGSQVPGMLYLPRYLQNSAMNGRRQYAEIEFTGFGGAGIDSGPAVFCAGSFGNQNQQGYQVAADSTTLYLNRLTTLRTGLATVAYTPTAGHVWRIECRPVSAGGNNLVTVYVNGVQTLQVTDSDATRPVAGFPGLWAWACNVGRTMTIARFACGRL